MTAEIKIFPAETRCPCGGQLAYLQDLTRGARTVACGVCRTPVHPNHPMQRRLDAEWVARDRADARPQPAGRPADYGGVQYGAGNTVLDKLTAQLDAVSRRVAALENRKK